MIQISRGIVIDEREIEFDFIRSSGPGGQNVNKVSTAVRLRFDVRRSHASFGRSRSANPPGWETGGGGRLPDHPRAPVPHAGVEPACCNRTAG